MKKVFLLFVCVASFAAANAQVKFGAKAGLNLANLVGPDVEDNKMKLGFHIGGFANIPLASQFSVQPELVFSAQGAKFEDQGDDDKYKLSYLNVPVMFQYNHASGFFAETGPQFGFLLAAKVKSDGNNVDVKDVLKTFDFAWALGAGYKFTEKVGVDLRWNFGLSKVPENDFKMRNSVLQAGVFYVLGSSKK